MKNQLFDLLAEAAAAIRQNTIRSLLTMLSMLVGTAAIITVLGVSSAARSGIRSTLASFDAGGLIVTVDSSQDDPLSATLQYRDVDQIRSLEAAWFVQVFPDYQRTLELARGQMRFSVSVTSEGEHPDATTIGTGRRIDAADVTGAAHVCNISMHLAQRLFGSSTAEGNMLRLQGTRFRVIGVFAEMKGSAFSSVGSDDFVAIPYTTFHQLAPGAIDAIQVFLTPEVATDEAITALQASLQRLHGPQARYNVADARAQLAAFNRLVTLLTVGLGAIGGIALFTAGIGIMNISLVSVNDRTREIGLRKTIGASTYDIAAQFLAEAILLACLGGAIGTILGLGITLLASGSIAHFVGAGSVAYLQIAMLACAGSFATGVVFGTYPALRAARMEPIAALKQLST